MNIPAITIAVRHLVETALRSGDLRYDFLGTVKAMEGIRAHQYIQRQRPEAYQAEVPVSLLVDAGGVDICVTGRVDGILQDGSAAVVEEIKSTRRSLDDLEKKPNLKHWAQVQCYAHMWAVDQQLDIVKVQLTYVHIESYAVRRIAKSFDRNDLALFFEDLIERYAQWARFSKRWRSVRQASIRDLDFPFRRYRPGQRDMAVAVYRTIRDQEHLLVQAATGIGKTMAAMFPAIKALAEEEIQKVVFLTARTTGRLAAESAVELLRGNGLKLKSVSLTAKDKVCFFPEAACVPEECECARGYYDRIDQALLDALGHDHMTRSLIEAIARDHCVCPFEFSLELVDWADCVICDYNYAFAPGVMLQRLFGEQGGAHTVLVDEAHNLVDRSRDMFSAHLDKGPILALRRKLKEDLPGIYRSLGRINAWMAKVRRSCTEAGGEQSDHILPVELIDRLRAFLRKTDQWLSLNLRTAFREDLLTVFFEAARFVRVADEFDKSYAVITTAIGDALRIKLFCIDPSHQLSQAWQRCHSAVLFSATLTPAGYFQSVLGCRSSASQLHLLSPFPRSNLAVYAANDVSILYRDRDASVNEVCRCIGALVRQRKGNYLLYFPSYAYMEQVHTQFAEDNGDIDILIQTGEMDESMREGFLGHFQADRQRTVVGFAVIGGIFGEGIDLKGERLSAVAVIGVGLPGICMERDLIRAYFNQINGDGFAFAYQYPGINRVLQAAGRVIRSDRDRGVVLLIDRRYGQRRYRSLLPSHWDVVGVAKGADLSQKLSEFWQDMAVASSRTDGAMGQGSL